MQNGRIIIKAGFLAVVSIMILSTATGAVIKNNQQNMTSENITKDLIGYGQGGTIGELVWDNQMDYDGLLRAEWDEIAPVDAFPADDFLFEKASIIKEVNWIGGYWEAGYNTSHWTWEIAFYEDDGTGSKPGNLHAGNFTFEVGNYTETFIEEVPEWSIYYEINVTLPEEVMFNKGEKYWILIWAVGNELPYPGWGFHYDSIILHEAVFKSFYFLNDTNWHNTGEVLGNPADMCFRLIYEEIPEDTTPPTVEIINPGKGVYFRDKYIFPRFIRLTLIIGKITVEVNATDNESGIDRVEFYYGPLGTKSLGNDTEAPYSLIWKRDRIRFVHLHFLKVVAYDNAGNNAMDRMLVRKIL